MGLKVFDWVREHKRYVAILIVILVVFSVIGISATSSLFRQDEELIAVAQSDRAIVRTEELVTFSSDGSKGDIKRVEWNFDDGNHSDERNPTHAYEFPGWYNVTMTLKSESGLVVNTTVVIGVQHLDTATSRTLGRDWDVQRSGGGGPCDSMFFNKYIEVPQITVTFDMTRAFGTYIALIEARYYDSEDQMHHAELVREEFTVTGGNYQYTRTIDGSELPLVLFNSHGAIDTCALIDQGKWESIEIRMAATFPMEGLEPPFPITP